MNDSDANDATPLYLAALIGNEEICKYLLEAGAKCALQEDSARIFYVALTPSLRSMLREWRMTPASPDPFLVSLRMAFENRHHPESSHADCVVNLTLSEKSGKMQRRSVFVHRVMVQYRCPWLAQRIFPSTGLSLPFSLSLSKADSEINGDVAIKLMGYLYSGHFETRSEKTTLSAKEISATWGLLSLSTKLEASIERFRENHSQGFWCNILDEEQLRCDMKTLALIASTPHTDFEDPESLSQLMESSDMTLRCQSHTWSVHRFRLVCQSEYFDRALQGNFQEACTHVLDLSHMVENPMSVRCLIQWLYADCFLEPNAVSLELAIEILQLGFAILCPRLSAYVVNSLILCAVTKNNVFDLLDLAQMHGCFDKLEYRCCEVIAENLDDFATSKLLRDVLAQEAMSIVQGGDIHVTDVPLAADIRRAIGRQKDLPSNCEKERRVNLLKTLVQEALQ